ncbi:hypothetical protein HDU93_004155 [Gonapodya sp. JEL0774]|nr:hypothetical protein HDU93_004155 [Gonapodya sp. JEL0774]
MRATVAGAWREWGVASPLRGARVGCQVSVSASSISKRSLSKVSPSFYRAHRLRTWHLEHGRQHDPVGHRQSRPAMGNIDLHFLPSGQVRTVPAGLSAREIWQLHPTLFPPIDPYIALFNNNPVCLQQPIVEQGVLELRGRPVLEGEEKKAEQGKQILARIPTDMTSTGSGTAGTAGTVTAAAMSKGKNKSSKASTTTPTAPAITIPALSFPPDPVSLSVLHHSTSHLLGAALEMVYGDEALLVAGSPALPAFALGGAVPVGTQSLVHPGTGFWYGVLLKKTLPLSIHASLEQVERSIEGESWLDPSDIRARLRDLLWANTTDIYSVRESAGEMDRLLDVVRQLVARGDAFERMVVPRDVAARMFAYNPFKLHFIATHTATANDTVTLYKTGDFIDLCKGPHVLSSDQIPQFEGAVALETVSSARWEPALADSHHPPSDISMVANQPITRVAGISFADPTHAAARAAFVQQAKDRDHRVIGKQQELFMFHKSSPGIPFMLPRGVRVVNKLKEMMRQEYEKGGYEEVVTPLVFGKEVWETSGHWENYREDMFIVTGAGEGLGPGAGETGGAHHLHFDGHHEHDHDHRGHGNGEGEGIQGLKPMNCPGHCLVFANQILSEIASTLSLISATYDKLGFTSYSFCLSTRPAKSMGSREQWDEAERDLRMALNNAGKPWTVNPGDGAFYGPKIDVHVTDALGRMHQMATVQLDFQLPMRFGLSCVDENGEKEVPVIVHRAVLGSVERMMAILCEHYAGKWPFWLSPRQALVVTVGMDPAVLAHGTAVVKELQRGGVGREGADAWRRRGFYVDFDGTDATVGKKVRSAQLGRYNFVLVVGKREAERATVSVRGRDGESLGEMGSEEVAELFKRLEDAHR